MLELMSKLCTWMGIWLLSELWLCFVINSCKILGLNSKLSKCIPGFRWHLWKTEVISGRINEEWWFAYLSFLKENNPVCISTVFSEYQWQGAILNCSTVEEQRIWKQLQNIHYYTTTWITPSPSDIKVKYILYALLMYICSHSTSIGFRK